MEIKQSYSDEEKKEIRRQLIKEKLKNRIIKDRLKLIFEKNQKSVAKILSYLLKKHRKKDV
jgi:predicted nucleic acid-binding protein